MIERNLLKKIGVILFIIILSTLSLKDIAYDSVFYDYEKKDIEIEQKKFINKLLSDKKKCDMAVENTKSLIDKSRNKPYLPELYLRLAELYIEKSRIVYFLRKANNADSIKSLDNLESLALKNQAIEIYQRILDNFPNFGDRDKVHFFMAHEYRELGQLEDMIAQYKAIIKIYKDSYYVPEAYLLIGDYFFNKQEIDLAKRHYEATCKYPNSSATAIARYKLAWCHINNANYKEAIKLFEESVTCMSSGEDLDIDMYKRVDIKLEALIDMAYCYCECYKESTPKEALAYFQKFAWSRPVYTVVLEKLAYRYLIKNKWHHSAEIYRQLSLLKNDAEKLSEYARKIFECVSNMKNFKAADQDVAIMIKALSKQKFSVHISDEEKEKNYLDFELYARDIITHLHHEAKGKNSITEFKRVADSYKLYLDFFTKSPDYNKMKANYAEALFSSQQYLEAGKQYEKLANKIETNDKTREEKLYSAVLSYYKALNKKEELNYYQVAHAQDGLKTCGKQYAKDFPQSERVPDVLFNVAWITYDEGKNEEAISEFTQFVELYPKSKEASAAIHLILDSFNMMEDYEGLAKFGRSVLSNSKISDNKLKDEIEKIITAAESKVVCSLTLDAADNWSTGKDNIFDFVDKHKSSAMGEQALYALIGPSKDKGDMEALINAGSKLIDQYPSSPKIEDVLSVMIDSSCRASQYRLLANYLEKFIQKFPKHKNVADFLYQAGKIRENLSQYDKANKNYQMILNSTKNKTDKSEEIIFTMANMAGQMSDIDMAINLLLNKREYLSEIGKIKADAKIANFYFQINEPIKAKQYRKRAKKLYSPKLAKKDSNINELIAKMEFNTLNRQFEQYMAMQLKDIIDNKIVTNKAAQLENLESGYHKVIQYKVPKWALAACYRSYEINKEFGRFLIKSPLPDLNPEEKEQYIQLINQKAKVYIDKSDQYLKTCFEQVRLWEICDPELAGYFFDPNRQAPISNFSKIKSSVEISEDSLHDETLKNLHIKHMQDPNNMNTLISLAYAYIEKNDINHAYLIIQNAMGDIKSKNLKAKAYNILGILYLYKEDDSMAKDAFKNAIKIDDGNIDARLNLAALYQHYGHIEQAKKLYSTSPEDGLIEERQNLIHPQALESYYAHKRYEEKLSKNINTISSSTR